MTILIGVLLLLISAGLVAIPVFSSFVITNFGVYLIFGCAFTGLLLVVLGTKIPKHRIG